MSIIMMLIDMGEGGEGEEENEKNVKIRRAD